jgi:hypothetical protein
MANLTNLRVTDGVTQVLATQYNRVVDSHLRGDAAQTLTMTTNLTLTADDYPLQYLNCNGANRTVTMPAPGSTNHPFWILNTTAATYTLTINNSAAAALAVLEPGVGVLVVSDGTTTKIHDTLPSGGSTGQFLSKTSSSSYDVGWVSGGSGDLVSPLVSAEISITSATALTISRMHVISGSTDFTPTLPAASGNAGKFIGARFTNTGVTTIDANASETIDGVLTRRYFQGQSAFWLCDGSNWFSANQKVGRRGDTILITDFNKSNAVTEAVVNGQLYNLYHYTSTPGNGDWLEVGFELNAGSYTCRILGLSSTDTGKIDWTLDGTSQTTGQDWYSAAGTYNVSKSFTLTAVYSGYHVLKGTVNGKNASSSSYRWYITCAVITPTTY